MKPERLSREVIYQSRWVNLYADRVRTPNGQIIERLHLLDFDHPAVMIIVSDEHENILLVRPWRYTTGRSDWEVPAGGLEAGETALEAAQREVREETGYLCQDYKQIYTYYPMNGIANQQFHIFACRAVEQVGAYDPGEIDEIRWFTRDEILALIRAQEIVDGPSLTALLLHFQSQTG
jgi:ADP-ribose pyrophosphatase